MNKSFAIIFLATFAIVGIYAEHKRTKFFLGPKPWIPLNIPSPRPRRTTTGAPGSGPAVACPPLALGCTMCGEAEETMCTVGDGQAARAPCHAVPCPAGCICQPACAAGCSI